MVKVLLEADVTSFCKIVVWNEFGAQSVWSGECFSKASLTLKVAFSPNREFAIATVPR